MLTSDPYVDGCQILPDVNTLTRNAASQAYEQAGIGPEDLDLVELHDCFATAELVHYDNLMLCEEGVLLTSLSLELPGVMAPNPLTSLAVCNQKGIQLQPQVLLTYMRSLCTYVVKQVTVKLKVQELGWLM